MRQFVCIVHMSKLVPQASTSPFCQSNSTVQDAVSPGLKETGAGPGLLHVVTKHIYVELEN